MSTKIGRSFDELNSKIKTLNSNLKQSEIDLKQINNDIKLNPGNVDAVQKKFKTLSTNLQINQEKLTALRQKQAKLNEAYENGEITQNSYNKQLVQTTEQIKTAEAQIEKLTTSLSKQNAEIRNAKCESLISGLSQVEAKAKALSVATLGVVTALTALTISSVNTGDELADSATHYGTTVENLQIWSNRLGMLASDEEAYTSSLSTVGSMMTSITAGRGTKYLTFLKELGIAQEDLNGKTSGEVFDLIYEGLRNVTDSTERATIAQGLLGDTGLEISVIAGTEQSALNELDEALLKNGIITTEQANVADATANKFLALKQQYQANGAELLTSLLPTIETLVNFLETSVIPIMSKVSSWLDSLSDGGQKALLVTLLIVAVLPKAIALGEGLVTVFQLITNATKLQAAAQAVLNAVTSPWFWLILAISAAIITLIALIKKLTKTTEEASESSLSLLTNLSSVSDQLTSMTSDLEVGGDVAYSTSNNKTIDINLEVTASSADGTAVSEQSAEYIAESLENKIKTDLINNELGAVIR
jgi:hypothetical protein